MSEKFTEKYQHCKTDEEHKFTIKNSLQSPGGGGDELFVADKFIISNGLEGR